MSETTDKIIDLLHRTDETSDPMVKDELTSLLLRSNLLNMRLETILEQHYKRLKLEELTENLREVASDVPPIEVVQLWYKKVSYKEPVEGIFSSFGNTTKIKIRYAVGQKHHIYCFIVFEYELDNPSSPIEIKFLHRRDEEFSKINSKVEDSSIFTRKFLTDLLWLCTYSGNLRKDFYEKTQGMFPFEKQLSFFVFTFIKGSGEK